MDSNSLCNHTSDLFNHEYDYRPNWTASSEKSHLSARVPVLSNFLGMMSILLLHCPISAEIRTIDSQSDLKILLQL